MSAASIARTANGRLLQFRMDRGLTQRAAAEKSKTGAAKRFDAPIVTEVVPLTKFYAAEGYHQEYFKNLPVHQLLITT